MSLSVALNSALSGLRVNEAQLAVTAQNIANANTVGYSRQIVDQSSTVLDGQGAGVGIEGISRRVDSFLQQSIISQRSEVGRIAVLDDFFERVQIFTGQPGNDNSLDEFTSDFFNRIEALGEAPDLTSLQNLAVDSGIILAEEVSNLAFELENLRLDADNEIAIAIDDVNRIIDELDVVNTALNRAAALDIPNTTLLDERDLLLDELSGILDVNFFFSDTEEVSISLRGGASLIDEAGIAQLEYRQLSGLDEFIGNSPFGSIEVVRFGANDQPLPGSITLVTGGTSDQVTTSLQSGRLTGLLQLRDGELPEILAQLDQFSASLRDTVNAIHNDGSGFPGAQELTGTRALVASESRDFSGSVRIGLTDVDGRPIPAAYDDESFTAFRPLNLDLGSLDAQGGEGAGRPTLQAIIDEVNNHFGPPPPRTSLNNINNIQLVSLTDQLPNGTSTFNFEFDFENISNQGASAFFVGATVLDDTGTDITGTNSTTIPSVTLDPANTFNTANGVAEITVATVGAHNFEVGQTVFIPPAGVPATVNGIPQAEATGFVTITAVTATGFTYATTTPAGAGPLVVGVPGVEASGSVADVPSGQEVRSAGNSVEVDFSGNVTSDFYDIQVQIAVQNTDPDNPDSQVVEFDTITYRVFNDTDNLINDRVNSFSTGGVAERVLPNNSQPFARAILVDADGNELASDDGNYGDQEGFLRIEGNEALGFFVHLDELSSQELGRQGQNPPEPGTGRGFSHFFGLNNFFEDNQLTPTGDTVRGSAINLSVQERFEDNPSLFSSGDLQQSIQPTDDAQPSQFTFERNSGDGSVTQRLAALGLERVAFGATGSLAETTTTFNGYAGRILAFSASQAAGFSAQSEDQQILLDGFATRADAISGVNLDEELANTILYQNSFTASARVITVTDELFETLLNSI